MNQADIDKINESSKEQGHRLRLEEGIAATLPVIPAAEKAYNQEQKEAEVIFGSQLQNVADKLNGTIIYQTIVNNDGTSYKRIIIEYEIKHD